MRSVVLSTTEAEYIALSQVAKEIKFIIQLMTNEVLFSIQFRKVRKENSDIFLKETMLDKKSREGEEE